LALAAVIALAVPIAALLLAPSDDDAALVLAPSSLAPIEGELETALRSAGIGPVEWVFAGSQSLVAQVADGVPADVVVVADAVAFAAVADTTTSLEGNVVLATNHLVLAVADGNPGAVSSIADLGDPELLVGLCAPEVPCGRLASAALADLGVEPVLDTEETSARGLTAKLASGELDAGLIYVTDALATELTIVADEELRPFVNEYIGLSTAAGRPILDVLASDTVAQILRRAGFAT
jgi:molybdate transport system substrate-binding protein